MTAVRTAESVLRGADRFQRTTRIGSYVLLKSPPNVNDTGRVLAIYKRKDGSYYFQVKVSDGPFEKGKVYDVNQQFVVWLED